MRITVQNLYDIQYLTMRLSGYTNAPKEPALLALRHGMDHLMHHPHEPMMYSIKKSFNKNESPHQCFFKAGDVEINKNQEYSNFLHTYCDSDHARDISDRRSVASTAHLFNGTVIGCSPNKQPDTYISSSNAETRAMYTGVLYQNCIRNFYRSIGYPIGLPSKLYKDIQATIKRVLADRISPQARPLDVLITALQNLCLQNTF